MARVLVLEPAQDVRELLARLLSRLGHEPVTADDHEHAPADAAVVEPADPDVLHAMRTLKSKRPTLPIVCASILPRSEIPPDLGFAAYVAKPFHLADLERALCAALERAS